MKKWTIQGAWMIISIVLLCGCVDKGKSLVVVYQVVPNDSCEYEVDPEYFRSRGHLDIGHGIYDGEPYYNMIAQVNNYMPSSLDINNAESNAFDIYLTKATIKYEWLKGRDEVLAANPALVQVLAVEDMEYVDYFNAHISAASESGEAGKAVFWFYMVPSEIGVLLYQLGSSADDVTLGVRVKLSGKTFGGMKVETNEFFYPIDLCYGCLNYVCCANTSSPWDDYYPACQPGQDTNDLLKDGCEDCEEDTY